MTKLGTFFYYLSFCPPSIPSSLSVSVFLRRGRYASGLLFYWWIFEGFWVVVGFFGGFGCGGTSSRVYSFLLLYFYQKYRQ